MNTQTTTTVKKSSAEIKVLAVNTLYQYAEKYFNHEKKRLSAFIGMDIFKVDGSFKQKYDSPKLSDKGQLPDGTWFDAHYWFTHSGSGFFDIHIKICINGGSYDVKPTTAFCQYEEQTFTLFKKVDGKLIDTPADIDFTKRRSDVKELQAIANEITEAAKVYEAIYNKMPYQFKDTFWLSRLSR